MSTFGIAVGGGPAPGINGVIGAAATRALSLGHRVVGFDASPALVENTIYMRGLKHLYAIGQ